MPSLVTDAGRRAWQQIIEQPGRALLCSDFDGVLSPIVADPDAAYASEAAITAFARLGGLIGKVAVVTGRPVRSAIRLGKLDQRPGLERLTVLGVYGFERWDAETGDFSEPDAPTGVAEAAAELPALFEHLGLQGVRLEDKRLSVGVHVRETGDPVAALAALREPLDELAARHGLHAEPGRNVIELRAPGVDKGDAVRTLAAETTAQVIGYAGDDLGDLAAFRAVQQLRAGGHEGLLVCSGSDEQDALVAESDVVVDGPDGVAALLTELADAIEAG